MSRCRRYIQGTRAIGLVRSLSTTRSTLLQHYARTTLNPKDFQLTRPTNFSSKSVLVMATPSTLLGVIDQAIDVYERDGVQVAVAGIDTVVPDSHRHGVSELWFSDEMEIGPSKPLDEDFTMSGTQSVNDSGSQSESVDEFKQMNVQTNQTWGKPVQSHLTVQLNETSSFKVQLANTLFTSGQQATLFYFQTQHLAQQGRLAALLGLTLRELQLKLPSGFINANSKVSFHEKWTPLEPESNEPLIVTNCIGNLVKEINYKPASHYLQNNSQLMGLMGPRARAFGPAVGIEQTQVFVKLHRPNSPHQRFQVIAGGGEYGVKSNILALSPQATVLKGDSIAFYILTPQSQLPTTPNNPNHQQKWVQNHLVLERSLQQQSYSSTNSTNSTNSPVSPTIIENTFGCGSEQGFVYNNTLYMAYGDLVSISI